MEQRTLTPRLRDPKNNFLYCSAQVKAILKAKRVWHVVRGDNVASSSASHHDRMSTIFDGAVAIVDSEFNKDVTCLVTLQGIGKIPFARVTVHQDDPRKL